MSNIKKNILVMINSDNFDSRSYNFIKFLKDNKFIDSYVDIFYGKSRKLVDLLGYFKKIGYRCIINTDGSDNIQSAFNYIKNNTDMVIFNTFSTAGTKRFMNAIPRNLIRTSVNDTDMLSNLINKILKNFSNYLQSTNNYKLSSYLANFQREYYFNKIVYIYEPSVYTLSFLDSIETIIRKLGLPTDVIELIGIQLDASSSELSEDAKFYLTCDNINSPNYKTNNNKYLFILNSSNRQSLINKLNNAAYYNNFIILGDPFSAYFETPYEFTAAFNVVSNYSEMGFRLSQFVDETQSIPNQILNILDILTLCSRPFINSITNNKKVTSFNYTYYGNYLKRFGIISNGKWNEEWITLNAYNGILVANNKYKAAFKPVSIEHNLDKVVLFRSSETTVTINDVDFGNNLITYENNVKRIQSLGGNVDTLLDSITELFMTKDDYILYINFLQANYKTKLQSYQYTEYYVYDAVIYYNIPVIELDEIEISQSINKSDYVISSGEDTNLSIAVTIPETSYYTKIYYYDTSSNTIIDRLTDNFSEEKYDSFVITLDDSAPEFYLHLFRGHVFKIGKYDATKNVFTAIKTIRSYAKLPIKMDWLIVEKIYAINDRVIILADNTYGTITAISENNYDIKVKLDATSVEEDYTQSDITRLLDLPEEFQ